MSTDIVEFQVVNKAQKIEKFPVHLKILCLRSQVFHDYIKALKPSGKEINRVMLVMNMKPRAVAFFVDWAYRGVLPDGHSKSYLVDMCYFWDFATRYSLFKLADEIMDKVRQLCKVYNQTFDIKFLAEIYDMSTSTSAKSRLQEFTTSMLIYELYTKKKLAKKGGDQDALLAGYLELRSWWPYVKDREALYTNLVFSLQRVSDPEKCEKFAYPTQISRNVKRSRCRYHVHAEIPNEDDTPCTNAEAKKEWIDDDED